VDADGGTGDDDWASVWRPLIDRIGTDVGDGEVIWGADPIERSAVRRYLEPLELDCALHDDPEVARAYGFADVTAPYTSFITFTMPAMWRPGDTIFNSAERHAQPSTGAISSERTRVAPQVTGYFVTEFEVDFLRPAVVGERLARCGSVLRSVVPKWISVGRGAFVTFEGEVSSDAGDIVARTRSTAFVYEPVGPPPASREHPGQAS
jgi:hypothetical protein